MHMLSPFLTSPHPPLQVLSVLYTPYSFAFQAKLQQRWTEIDIFLSFILEVLRGYRRVDTAHMRTDVEWWPWTWAGASMCSAAIPSILYRSDSLLSQLDLFSHSMKRTHHQEPPVLQAFQLINAPDPLCSLWFGLLNPPWCQQSSCHIMVLNLVCFLTKQISKTQQTLLTMHLATNPSPYLFMGETSRKSRSMSSSPSSIHSSFTNLGLSPCQYN